MSYLGFLIVPVLLWIIVKLLRRRSESVTVEKDLLEIERRAFFSKYVPTYNIEKRNWNFDDLKQIFSIHYLYYSIEKQPLIDDAIWNIYLKLKTGLSNDELKDIVSHEINDLLIDNKDFKWEIDKLIEDISQLTNED